MENVKDFHKKIYQKLYGPQSSYPDLNNDPIIGEYDLIGLDERGFKKYKFVRAFRYSIDRNVVDDWIIKNENEKRKNEITICVDY
jgi:hypothetical protein